MKKFSVLLAAIVVVAALSTSSCGPTAEEKAKMDQAHQDSMKAVEDMQKAAEDAAIMQAAAEDTLKPDSLTTDSVK